MKYAKIATTLGWSEEPATVAEGIFLQPEEAATVETALAAADGVDMALKDAKTAEINLTEQIASLNIAAENAVKIISDNEKTIAELQAQVTTLGKGSSGAEGSTINTSSDQNTATTENAALPRFDSPEHPANQAAAKIGRITKR